ncbi:DNA-binding response regulator, NarL/FixJ family, contains REC and HTH domains [Friedmanniella luteola]|uniref:DNA-binding response regulator, NarL/FixJ family, contains REC and HTH domains n=1 Tax=Friedmanniella luteola TaxID=546871 RepID=A0A1H2ABW7_9ACTN|nr:response regulator transcription factor [Friedmanniella luteola]SDT43461.1 DNA-binding response regulator, NarL/FixJ family, contains REC and HTH domains [Friedmanniella luteola]
MSNGGNTDGAALTAPRPSEVRDETTVLVVDDHQCFSDLLTAALAAVPGFRCLGTASSAAEGVELAGRLRPDVVVMDIQMPGTDGLAATRRLRQASPATAVAVVTAHTDAEWVARAAQAGASAFIPKGGTLAEMVDLLRSARPGRMVVAPSLRRTAPVSTAAGAPDALTARELEVLGYIGQGLQAKSVARVMGISVHTCRGYIKTVYAKLHVSSRIEAVNRARQLQLLDS